MLDMNPVSQPVPFNLCLASLPITQSPANSYSSFTILLPWHLLCADLQLTVPLTHTRAQAPAFGHPRFSHTSPPMDSVQLYSLWKWEQLDAKKFPTHPCVPSA